MKYVARPCLPPSAYTDPSVYEQEKADILRRCWQWAGLLEDTLRPGGLLANIAEVPVSITQVDGKLHVALAAGERRDPLAGASAEACGRFVFVHLDPAPEQTLAEFLGSYAPVLHTASEEFDEVFDADIEEWACNWKSGLEITLEGYHVPFVHGGSYDKDGKKKSNFANAVPKSRPPQFNGPHSNHTGVMSEQMRTEMTNIAKRLKIKPSGHYHDYDHFTLFPNMTIGFSGGNLCFMQIYSPLGPRRTELRYSYILARPIDPAQKPVALIKKTLLDTWRDYTDTVLGEDKLACEGFQRGVAHATRTGCIGKKVERRVGHFHDHWRARMAPATVRDAQSEAA